MTKKAAKLKPAATPNGPPPAPKVSPFRAELVFEMTSRLRLTFAEPAAEQAAEATRLFQLVAKIGPKGVPSQSTLDEMRRQVWALLLDAETRTSRGAPWEPAADGWREELWAMGGGLFRPESVLFAWGELFRASIRIAVRRQPRPRRDRA